MTRHGCTVPEGNLTGLLGFYGSEKEGLLPVRSAPEARERTRPAGRPLMFPVPMPSPDWHAQRQSPAGP